MNTVAPTSPQADSLTGGDFGLDEGLAELTPGTLCIPGREGLRRAEARTSPSAPHADVGSDSSPHPAPAQSLLEFERVDHAPAPHTCTCRRPLPRPGWAGRPGEGRAGLGEATHALPT